MSSQERRQRGFKATDSEWERWRAAARSEGKDLGPWLRDLADAAATGTDAEVVADPDVDAALDRLCARYLAPPRVMIGMAIRAIDRMVRMTDLDPFNLAAGAEPKARAPRKKRSGSG